MWNLRHCLPDVDIFIVGAETFRCAEVLFLTKTYLGRMTQTRFETFIARHVHGDPDGPVRFGTHFGRVAHVARVRRLHSASCHLRLGGRDFTEYIMKRNTDRQYSFTSPQRGRSLWMSQRNFASFSAGHDTELTSAVMDKERGYS